MSRCVVVRKHKGNTSETLFGPVAPSMAADLVRVWDAADGDVYSYSIALIENTASWTPFPGLDSSESTERGEQE